MNEVVTFQQTKINKTFSSHLSNNKLIVKYCYIECFCYCRFVYTVLNVQKYSSYASKITKLTNARNIGGSSCS